MASHRNGMSVRSVALVMSSLVFSASGLNVFSTAVQAQKQSKGGRIILLYGNRRVEITVPTKPESDIPQPQTANFSNPAKATQPLDLPADESILPGEKSADSSVVDFLSRRRMLSRWNTKRQSHRSPHGDPKLISSDSTLDQSAEPLTNPLGELSTEPSSRVTENPVQGVSFNNLSDDSKGLGEPTRDANPLPPASVKGNSTTARPLNPVAITPKAGSVNDPAVKRTTAESLMRYDVKLLIGAIVFSLVLLLTTGVTMLVFAKSIARRMAKSKFEPIIRVELSGSSFPMHTAQPGISAPPDSDSGSTQKSPSPIVEFGEQAFALQIHHPAIESLDSPDDDRQEQEAAIFKLVFEDNLNLQETIRDAGGLAA